MESPIAAKDVLAQLDGEFPLDKAVIEGTNLGHSLAIC